MIVIVLAVSVCVLCVHRSLQHAVTKSLQSSRGLQSLMNRLLTRCSPVLVDAKGIQCLTEMALTTLGEADSEDEEEREAVMHILQLMEVSSRCSTVT